MSQFIQNETAVRRAHGRPSGTCFYRRRRCGWISTPLGVMAPSNEKISPCRIEARDKTAQFLCGFFFFCSLSPVSVSVPVRVSGGPFSCFCNCSIFSLIYLFLPVRSLLTSQQWARVAC
ncbi:hypothetical protein LX36DRAFT_373395 [Colletotrichum falcatum]|nr:hypothetical protein LX36DRAFT_373395 [Colletotrichum falcatum]